VILFLIFLRHKEQKEHQWCLWWFQWPNINWFYKKSCTSFSIFVSEYFFSFFSTKPSMVWSKLFTLASSHFLCSQKYLQLLKEFLGNYFLHASTSFSSLTSSFSSITCNSSSTASFLNSFYLLFYFLVLLKEVCDIRGSIGLKEEFPYTDSTLTMSWKAFSSLLNW